MNDNTYYPLSPTYVPRPYDAMPMPYVVPMPYVPISVPSANDAAWYQKEIDRLNKELDELRRKEKPE